MLQEGGLAHARFASHHERASLPGSDVVDQAFDATLFVIPADQHRLIVRPARHREVCIYADPRYLAAALHDCDAAVVLSGYALAPP